MPTGPPPIYKYSLLYTFLSSFLLPYRSWRCSNTPPQSPLRDLLVDVAIWTASDEEMGKRENRKDGGASSVYQSSNINSYRGGAGGRTGGDISKTLTPYL